MTRSLLLVALVPVVAWPCSLTAQPENQTTLQSVQDIPVLSDGGSDTTAPSKVAVSGLKVTLFRDPCDGAGAACPQLDSVTMTVTATDDQTPVERLRYVAFFGATAAAATSATGPEILFNRDGAAPQSVTAWLGLNRARSGEGFRRATLCFALAAVDEAGNVGERSTATCVDTTDEKASTTVMVAGAPCTPGCSGCSGAGGFPVALLALGVLLRRRR